MSCFTITLIILALYFLIPLTQSLNYQTTVGCTQSAVSRQIINKNKWQIWWPGQMKDSNNFTYKNYNYTFGKILLDGIETAVFNNKESVNGMFQFIYYGTDSTQLQWTSGYQFSINPLKRFEQYFEIKKIKNNIENLLEDLKKYFSKTENIYGMKIEKQKTVESSMISLKKTFSHYPTTAEVYAMIGSIKEYIHKAGGEERDFPMLNVQREDSLTYETMAAIPTKSELPTQDTFQLKRMMLGNILMGEVKGGINTIINEEAELTNYVNDYKKTSPAIPFQSLVTNRLTEPDTSKWITRLYYPIFN